jgi:hypothetical protein
MSPYERLSEDNQYLKGYSTEIKMFLSVEYHKGLFLEEGAVI